MTSELHALVGMRYRDAEAFVAALPNEEPLELRREPSNEHDRWAIQVWARGRHVGYLSSARNTALATALDQGVGFSARLHRSAADRWPLVEVQR